MTSALVAARDAAATVGPTVEALLALPAVDAVLVVDDGSADDTAELARAAGAWVLSLPANRGKGGAVAAGVAAMDDSDVYLLVDADLATTAAGCESLLGPVVAGEADMTVGVLPSAGRRGGFGLVRELARRGIRRACGFNARAPLSGQRAVRGTLLRSLSPAPRFGLEVGLTIDAVRAGARVLEVPIDADHRHRGRGVAGFAHRGRQGIDIGRALWPRLTSSRVRVTGIVLAALLVAVAMLAVGERQAGGTAYENRGARAERVLIVGLPGVGWDDVGPATMPALDRLARSATLGAMTVRTRSDRPGVTEAYATLGAGSRVRSADSAASVLVPGNGRTVVVDAAALAAGAGRSAPTPPGTLGDALSRAGLRTAVVGNADVPVGLVNVASGGQVRPGRFHPAAAALADATGAVDVARMGPELLVSDGSAPFGLRADADAVVEATFDALAETDVVLVDSGDLTRVAALADGEEVPGRYRERALADADALLGRLAAGLPKSTLLLAVSVVPPGAEWGLTPVVAAGAGLGTGDLYSPSTRQRGLVTLTDVAPTVLRALGAPVPDELVGHAVASVPGRPDVARLANLDAADSYRQRWHVPVVAGFVLGQLVLYALVASQVRRRRVERGTGEPGDAEGPGDPGTRVREARVREALRLGVLAVAAFPLATFLFRAASFTVAWGGPGLAVLVGIDLALVALTRLPGLAAKAQARPLAALAWVLAATVVVIVADVATGGRLQTASFMGYHPHVAGRFYGIGNTAFAVLASSAVLAVAVHVEHAPRRREALVSAAAVLVLVALADGAPSVGDDVGGILTLVPVFLMTALALAGRRISGRVVGGVLAATVAVLGLAIAADLLRSPGDRTHLGRLAAVVAEDGPGPLLATMARKAETSLGILGGSPWTWMAPVTAVVLAEVLARRRVGRALLPPGSPRRTAALSILAVGFLGALVNDSGVVVTALVLAFLGVFCATVALSDEGRGKAQPVLLAP